MRKNSIKMQLKSMNKALEDHADKLIKKAELKSSDANTIKQNVLYSEPYNNIEVLRSNKIYKTVVNRARHISSQVEEISNND